MPPATSAEPASSAQAFASGRKPSEATSVVASAGGWTARRRALTPAVAPTASADASAWRGSNPTRASGNAAPPQANSDDQPAASPIA